MILDRCGTHGVWLEGSELRRLTGWWRAGGKHLHQQNEAEKAKKFYSKPSGGADRMPMMGTTEPEQESKWGERVETGVSIAWAVAAIASLFLD